MDLETLKKKHAKKIERFSGWVKIKRSNLDGELSKNPSRIFNVGLNLADAEHLVKISKGFIKKAKADVRLNWSKKTIGGKKLNIPQIDAKVDSDPTVLKAENDYYSACYALDICVAADKGMKDKSQQLSNISNNYRAEMNYNFVKQSKEDKLKHRLKNK